MLSYPCSLLPNALGFWLAAKYRSMKKRTPSTSSFCYFLSFNARKPIFIHATVVLFPYLSSGNIKVGPPVSSDPSGRRFLWYPTYVCYNSCVIMIPTLGNDDYPRGEGQQALLSDFHKNHVFFSFTPNPRTKKASLPSLVRRHLSL